MVVAPSPVAYLRHRRTQLPGVLVADCSRYSPTEPRSLWQRQSCLPRGYARPNRGLRFTVVRRPFFFWGVGGGGGWEGGGAIREGQIESYLGSPSYML